MTEYSAPPVRVAQESEDSNEVSQQELNQNQHESSQTYEDKHSKAEEVDNDGDQEDEDVSLDDSSLTEDETSSSSSNSGASNSTTRKPIPPKLSNKAKHSIHYTSLGSISQSLQDLKLNDNTRNTTRNLLTGKKVVIKANGMSYTTERVVGNGSFGVVFKATVVGTREVVAIKKVLQDKRFKNRELQIMRMLDHPNVVKLHNSFYTNGDTAGEVYLNLVLEYVPETVYRVSRQYSKLRIPMPTIYIKLYMFQLCRAIAYIHSLGICHRDIKPQNLLIDPQACILKLCDFGSAKILVEGEPNVSYICSRYYRAPELIFGATNYTTAIDLWSMGCVMAELLLGQPLFPGSSGVDQLVEIIKVLGTPDREEIMSMNKNYLDYNFPQIKGHDWKKIFRSRTPTDAIDLIQQLLVYTPSRRLHPLDACCHPFFDELRDPNCKLPNGRPLPPLFDFCEAELKDYPRTQTLLQVSHPVTSTKRSESSDTKAPEDEPDEPSS